MKKKIFQLQIPEPCQRGWQNMTPTEKGTFCAHCQKEVIDFTQKTASEIAQYFAAKKGKSCGRFFNKQLNEVYTYYEPQKQNNLKYAAGLALGLLVAENNFARENVKPKTEISDTIFNKLQSDTVYSRTISGIIKDSATGETLVGVNVTAKGTMIGTVTDIDGKYSLEIPKSITTLIFNYVGFVRVEKPILSIKMDVTMAEDMNAITMGELVHTVYIVRNPDPVYLSSQQQNPHWRKKKKDK